MSWRYAKFVWLGDWLSACKDYKCMTELIGKQGLILRPGGKVYMMWWINSFLLLWNRGIDCGKWVEVVECWTSNGEWWMMRGIRLANRVPSAELYQSWYGRVGFENVIVRSCLHWYGHVICQVIETQIHEVLQFQVAGKRPKGSPRKRWISCMWHGKDMKIENMEILRLSEKDMEDWER